MSPKASNAYQFKIALEGIKPMVWRRIVVPENYSFADLHDAIQSAMGWEDSHLHEFTIFHPQFGEKIQIAMDDETADDYAILEDDVKISDCFSLANKIAYYEYDFGDCWKHKITLEKILPLKDNVVYPLCVGGARACPPEDCGGVWGYEDLLEIIADPKHERYQEKIDWLSDDFDPENFDHKLVKFRNVLTESRH